LTLIPHGSLAFGTNHERSIDFITRELDCPFVDSSKQKNPSVGQYDPIREQKKKQVHSSMAGGYDTQNYNLRSEFAKDLKNAINEN